VYERAKTNDNGGTAESIVRIVVMSGLWLVNAAYRKWRSGEQVGGSMIVFC
jgi:hypothetical protein